MSIDAIKLYNHARQYGRRLKNSIPSTHQGKAVISAVDTVEKGLITDFLKVGDADLPLSIKAKLIAARQKHV